MENKVTFDYSKAVNVVGTEEVAAMEKMVEAAKECWYSNQDWEMISLAGLTFL